MNKTVRTFAILFVFILALTVFAGCSSEKNDSQDGNIDTPTHQSNAQQGGADSGNHGHGGNHSSGGGPVDEDKPKDKGYVKKDIGTLIIDPAYTTADGEWHWAPEQHFSSSLSGSTVTMTCDFVSATDIISETDIEEKGFGAFRLDIYNWDEDRFDYEGCILTIRFDKIELSSPSNTIRFGSYEKTYKMEMRTDVEEMGRNFACLDITSVSGINSLEELSEYTLTVNATVLSYEVDYKE